MTKEKITDMVEIELRMFAQGAVAEERAPDKMEAYISGFQTGLQFAIQNPEMIQELYDKTMDDETPKGKRRHKRWTGTLTHTEAPPLDGFRNMPKGLAKIMMTVGAGDVLNQIDRERNKGNFLENVANQLQQRLDNMPGHEGHDHGKMIEDLDLDEVTTVTSNDVPPDIAKEILKLIQRGVDQKNREVKKNEPIH